MNLCFLPYARFIKLLKNTQYVSYELPFLQIPSCDLTGYRRCMLYRFHHTHTSRLLFSMSIPMLSFILSNTSLWMCFCGSKSTSTHQEPCPSCTAVRIASFVIGQVSFDNFNKLCKIYQIIEKYTACNSVLHNLFFKAIFGQDYPNLGRVMQHTSM